MLGLFFFIFFFIKFLSSPKQKFITKNLVITYKLSTIESFYHKVNNFVMVLVFLSFYHNPNEITKENVEKEIKECVVGVNM